MFGPLLLLLPLITPALLQVNDREYNKICPRNDDMVTLPSGNKVRYLCDDCLLDPKAKYISPTTIEECADIGSIAKDCKATMWSGGKCWCTDMSYTGSSNPTSKGCIWMTSETRSGKQDDCTTCLNEKKECVDKRRQCEDNLKHCNPDDKDCEKKARKCQDDLISCESEKEKYIKKERKCQDDFTGCENEKDSCVKKGRRCQNDLITCENDKDGCDKRERRCSDDQASCENEKTKCLKEQEKCQSDRQDSQGEADRLRRLFNDCTDDLDKCKKSSSSWGGTDGEIKCNSGSLTTASFNGGKWLTLCGFIIKDIEGEIRGLDFQECVEACSKDDKCRAITYDNNRGDCYKAHKFTTGDMRYSGYYDTVLRLA